MYFTYSNFKFKKHAAENWLMINGEITNNCGKSFNSVVFRLVVFKGSTAVCNMTITINGFQIGQTRVFEKQVGELDYKVASEITKYDMYAESAY